MTPASILAKPSHNEVIKEAIPTLAGTIAQTLADPTIDRFSDDDNQFLKFHGIYQEDDRDVRKTGKKYIMMVRLRLPGGIMSPDQYLACDALSRKYANGTLRVTSRQSIQFHGIVKSGLGPLMKGLNEAMISTLSACGDVNRNVIAPPTPAMTKLGEEVQQLTRDVAMALAPRTKAYHSIWVDGVQLNLDDPENKEFVDPLYGKTYLPRKFKVGFVIPPLNDIDVFTNCCGFIAIADEQGKLAGFNLTAGGGMGKSHGNNATFPRLADVIGFIRPEQVVETAKTVLTIHRDFGDRSNRKHARLKYVLADRGVEWFRQEMERRLGFKFEAAKPFRFNKQGDPFGWGKQMDGKLFLGLFIETGRIQDKEGWQMLTALRELIAKHRFEIRLTPSNNMLLVNIDPSLKAEVQEHFARHGINLDKQASLVRSSSMACVALPTCNLALSEAERYLPKLMTEIEALLEETGIGDQDIIIRMTGCPNGCARPYMAEISLVGKSPGKYQVLLGGNEAGTRMNRPWKDNVRDAEIVNELRPVLARYVRERSAGERFGDFVERAIWPEQGSAAVQAAA